MLEKFQLGVDKIYGENFTELPVIIDLVKSTAFQRLKGINQFGIPDEFYHLKNFSRYEHSIGVMLLLKQLGASDEEQVAGLLHDVSHKAFSHVYDWVVTDYKKGTNKEESQDKGHRVFINNTNISSILKDHGFSVEQMTDYHNFSLLERELPALCADRVDYSLRELDRKKAIEIYKGLQVFNGQIVCNDFETASKFGNAFLTLQTEHWGGYEATSRYHQFSSILKRAVLLGVISQEDFDIDDNYIIEKLKLSSDGEIQRRLKYLRQIKLPGVVRGVTVYKKFRFIDPPFLSGDKLLRLTEVDNEFVLSLNEAKEKNKTGYLVSD